MAGPCRGPENGKRPVVLSFTSDVLVKRGRFPQRAAHQRIAENPRLKIIFIEASLTVKDYHGYRL